MKPSTSLRRVLPLALLGIALTDILVLGRANQVIPAAALLVALFLLGFLLLWLAAIRSAGPTIAASPLDTGLLLFLAAILISTALSIDPSRSGRLAWSWLAGALFFYCSLALFRSGFPPRTAAWLSLLILTIFILFGYQELLSWFWAFPAAERAPLLLLRAPRLTGLTGSANLLGTMLAIGLLLAFGLAPRNSTRGGPFAAAVWAAAAAPIFLLTRSRSGFLALFAGLAVVAFFFAWQRIRRQKSWRPLLLPLAGLLVAGLLGGALLLQLRPDGLGGATTGIRLTLWQTAWENWLTRPLFGTGLDTESSANLIRNHPVPVTFPLRYAHSLWLTTLSGAGLAGLGALLVIGWQLLRWILRQGAERWSPFSLALLGTLAAMALHATVDTPEPWIMAWSALLLAALIAEEPAGTPAGAGRLHLLWLPLGLILVAAGIAGFLAGQNYERGIAAAEAGDWSGAAAAFDRAADRIFYRDSASLLAAGLAHGTLAAGDPDHLPPAIGRFEALIAREPGWPGNHANLAWLYRQAGRPQAALAAMTRAVEIAPESAIFRLNLALLAEEQGAGQSAAAWSALHTLPAAWHGAPLWEGYPEATASQPPEPGGDLVHRAIWDALAAGDAAAANRLLDQLPTGEPWPLGRGLAALLAGDLETARETIDLARSTTGSLESFLWQNWLRLADAPAAEQRRWSFDQLTTHSIFTVGGAGTDIYPFDLLSRHGLPVDLLPGLICFSSNDALDRSLAVLQAWHAGRGTPDRVGWIAELRAGTDGRGLARCTGRPSPPS